MYFFQKHNKGSIMTTDNAQKTTVTEDKASNGDIIKILLPHYDLKYPVTADDVI